MNVKVSRRALENTLRALLEADDPSPSTTAAETPAAAEAPPAETTEAPAAKTEKETAKSKSDLFADKVKELQKMKSGEPFAVGDRKFVKKAGAFYLAGAQEGMSTEELLALVRPEFREEVGKKLQKSIREKTGSAGVTIMGDQFIDSTERSATFKYGGPAGGSTVWKDMAGIPVQVIAQYYFQVEQGEEFGSDVAGSIAADVLGPAGAQVLTYRSDELMIVIDPSTSNMYIMSAEYNDYDPLLATKTLLTQIKLNDKVGDAGQRGDASVYDGRRRGYNAYLKPDGSGEKYAVPLRNFDLGELRKAIGSVRTIFSKFFDLFNTDDIEMNFAFTKWGPAMMRSKVFASTGFEGGTGAMTSRALDKLKNTGLFREESLLPAGIGTYNVMTVKTQDLAELLAGQSATPVTVTPVSGLAGAIVEGLQGVYGIKYTGNTDDSYENTYGDAYLLYMGGVMTAEAPREEAEAGPEAGTPTTGTPPGQPDVDPLIDICKQQIGTPVAKGAAFFQFNKTEYVVPPEIAGYSADAYVDAVVTSIKQNWSTILNKFYNADKPVPVTVIGTADQIGKDNYNQGLSDRRCDTLIESIKAKLGTDIPVSFTKRPTGETFWRQASGTEPNETRVYKRYAKVYWCELSQQVADTTTFDYVKNSASEEARELSGRPSSETASGGTKTGTPEKGKTTTAPPKLSLDQAQQVIKDYAGLTLEDGSYTYAPQVTGTVIISGGPNNLKDVVWSVDQAGEEKWRRFAEQLDKTKYVRAQYLDKGNLGFRVAGGRWGSINDGSGPSTNYTDNSWRDAGKSVRYGVGLYDDDTFVKWNGKYVLWPIVNIVPET